MLIYYIMATSLNAIADLLVPEEERNKDNSKNEKVDYDDESEEFKRQMDLAIQLSMANNHEGDPTLGSHTASPANRANRKKFRKLHPASQIPNGSSVEQKNKANGHKSQNGSRMFAASDLSELSYEEQLAWAEERSKFDVALDPSPTKVADEEELLKIALQKSTDPNEHINREEQLFIKALEESKRDAPAFVFASSDSASTGSSTSLDSYPMKSSSSGSGVGRNNSGFQVVQGRGWGGGGGGGGLGNSRQGRRRSTTGGNQAMNGGLNGGSGRPLSAHSTFITPSAQFNQEVCDGDDDIDDELQLAIKLSLGESNAAAYVSSLRNNPATNSSYLAVAQKPPLIVDSPKMSNGRNVYADPARLIRRAPPPARASVGNRRRPVIIDGCNVAFQHGKNDRFSAKGLLIVYQYFVDRFGYTENDITIVSKRSKSMSPDDEAIIEELYKINVLIYAPSRLVGGRLVCSDDDLFVLNIAKEKNGVVVSLDQFRDAYANTRDKEIKNVIKSRLLQFAFKGDEVIFPSDPLGPNGPSLNEFLKY